MRLTRVYLPPPLATGAAVEVPSGVARHLVRVLRLGQGDPLRAFDGTGGEYDAVIESVRRNDVVVRIGAHYAIERESPLDITLLQGIARGEKMDLVLQKATELGVARIVPVDAERTEVRLDGERLRKRMEHWRGVVASACEQSGRARVPAVDAPVAIDRIAGHVGDATVRLCLDPEGDCTLSGLGIAADATVALAIGPEGGWSPRDRELLRAAGFRGLRLGPRILRTETAGLAAIAALQAAYGDLRG